NALKPVRLPPGRLRLATSPDRTGSAPTPNTIGMLIVAAVAARAGSNPGTTITALEVEPDQPPTRAVDQLGFPPSDIQSPSSGLHRSRFGLDLAGVRSAGRRRTPAIPGLNTRSPASRAAARAPRATTRRPHRRAA